MRKHKRVQLALTLAVALFATGGGAPLAGATRLDPIAGVAGEVIAARRDEATPRVSAVESVGMTVADMDRSVRFYTSALPFVVESDREVSGRSWEQLQGVFGARLRIVTLRLGAECLELTQYLAPRGRPMPADSRGNDRWFQHVAIIVSDMDAAYARLRSYDVPHASSGPQRLPDWNPGAAGIRAFYFRDPDGHFLEVLQFPPGKGLPRWQERRQGDGSDRTGIFLGIDHTAIVVGQTAAALSFYRDTLGLQVAGMGVNHGPEQEQLSGVFGVRLRITTLRAQAGPAVELLEYVTPRDGRPTPADLKANDVAHWQITMRGTGLDSFLDPGPAWQLVSPAVTAVDGSDAHGFTRGVLVRDADGHGVRLVQ